MSAKGTDRGVSLGFPASNRPAAFRGITRTTFRDGRIVEGWDAWNQGRLLQDLQSS
jgi:SnoaL-like polyketide cyclase